MFGDGSQLRDFTYVSDAVDAFLRAALVDEAYGGRSTWAASSRSRCSTSRSSARRSPARAENVETVPWPEERKKIDIGSIYVDHSRLTELTGWEPMVGLREGLAETIRFYREHGEHYWA